MTTNADILRKLLWAAGTDQQPDELHRITTSRMIRDTKTGRVLLVSRARMESILDELEGKEPRPVSDDIFNDGEEYPDPFDIPDLADIEREQRLGPRRGRPRKNGQVATSTAEYRQRAADALREKPAGVNQLQLAAEVGIPASSLRRVFSDPRFVRDRDGTVRLSDGQTQRQVSQKFGNRSLLNATQAIYTELATFGPRTVSQLVAELKFDAMLVAKALESSRFVVSAAGLVTAVRPLPKRDHRRRKGDQ